MSASKDTLPKAIEEIPLDAIGDLASTYEQVVVRVKRRNDKGQLGTCYSSVRFETMDLAKIDDWCRDMAGGGHYRVEVLRPDDPTKYAMSPFTFRIEGPPRPPRYLGNPTDQSPAPNPPGGPMSNGYQYPAPPQPWAQGLDPSQRAHYAPPTYVVGGSRFASRDDDGGGSVALKQIADLKAEVERIRGEGKAQTERLEQENRRLQERLDEERRRAAEERHAAELAALRAMIEDKREREREAAGPKTSSMADAAAALAPFVPVLTTLLTSRESQQQRALDAQMTGMQTLMKATLDQANKGLDLEKIVTTWGPLVTPLITKLLDQKSPEQQAALFQAMADNNLNAVAMMAQLIEAFGSKDGEQPWWLPMVQETLGGVVQMTEAYMQGKGGLPGQQMPGRQLPQPLGTLHGPPQQVHAPQPAAPPQTAKPVGYTTVEAPSAAEVKPGVKMLFSLLPTDYQTVEWRTILSALHTEPPTDAERTATLLAGHLEHLISFDLLPETLETLTEAPRATLEALLEKLPVARSHPDHARRVLDRTLAFLLEDGFVADGTTDETETDEAVVEVLDVKPTMIRYVNEPVAV